MPVDLKRYPPNWADISHRIRFERAGGRCEGGSFYPDCRAVHGEPHPETGSIVVLTTAHMGAPLPDGSPGDKHNKLDVRDENLRALCQRCHLAEDVDEHIQNRIRNQLAAQEAAGQLVLIEE